MALVKEQNVVGIEVLEDNSIKVSTKVIVKDGDETVAGKSDYYVLPILTEGEPTDVSSEDARVQAVAGAVWTDEVIAAAQAAAAPAAEESE